MNQLKNIITQKFTYLTRQNKDLINIMPLQTGGILSDAAKEALMEFGDGYSVCDFCNGVLDQIKNPPIEDLVHNFLPRFLDCDVVRLTTGAREGKFSVLHGLTEPGDTIIVDSNRHYTTAVAAERIGLNVIEVPNSGYPEYRIDVEDYVPLIEKRVPKVILLTYPDGNCGNLADAKRLGEIARQHNVPYLLNGAYAIGRMPISLKEIDADFVVGSAHKSMASAGPSGVLGMKKEWEDIILRKSKVYSKKEIELLGCTSRGVTIATLMASLPHVMERVQNWAGQIAKAQWFSEKLEGLGMKQLGEKPHKHDLISFESLDLYEISKTRREKGYFLYKELRKRGIWGIKPGQSKKFKVSTFAATRNELGVVIDAFNDIIVSYC
ncbi:MAG: O-phospho-L-seryl-tRNA:Cys-tRNA synthase [Desulfobacterales bacterium]|nr:O-phospho-L-seryl-tRNA:Cys-tRNA synthase [Desulfobacterales bacterium]